MQCKSLWIKASAKCINVKCKCNSIHLFVLEYLLFNYPINKISCLAQNDDFAPAFPTGRSRCHCDDGQRTAAPCQKVGLPPTGVNAIHMKSI